MKSKMNKPPAPKGEREGVDHFPVPKGLLQAARVGTDEEWETIPEHDHGKAKDPVNPAVKQALKMGGRRPPKQAASRNGSTASGTGGPLSPSSKWTRP